MQDVVETMIARQLGSVHGCPWRPHISENDVRSLNENNLTNRNFHSHQNVSKLGEESPYTLYPIFKDLLSSVLEVQQDAHPMRMLSNLL